MKKILSLVLFFTLVSSGKIAAQHDTLFTRSNENIVCKVLEIGVTEIRYKKASYPDGPTFIIDRNEVTFIVFASGIKDVLQQPGSGPSSQQPGYSPNQGDGFEPPRPVAVMQKDKALKFEPFALLEGKMVVGYEQSIKTWLSLEAKIGYVNTNFLKTNVNSSIYGYNYYYFGAPVITGGFFKGGIKFNFGQDYRYKGAWFKHPLKGSYLRVNGIYTTIKTHYSNAYYYNGGGPPIYYPVDISVLAYGIIGDYGYQFVIGNLITLDMYVGFGYASYYRTTNDPYYNMNGYYRYYYTGSYYYSHTALGNTNSNLSSTAGVIFNTGMTVGFAFK